MEHVLSLKKKQDGDNEGEAINESPAYQNLQR
jgi:hypothetical protein